MQFNIFAGQSFYLSRLLLLFGFFLITAKFSIAQVVPDSTAVPVRDSLFQKDSTLVIDSLKVSPVIDSVSSEFSVWANVQQKDSGWVMDPLTSLFTQKLNWQLLQRHPYFGFSSAPVNPRSDLRQHQGKEMLFYLIVLLLLVFAFLRRSFPKYFYDLFRLFFRTTLKQRQISEQLMETPLPSLLLNGFFVVSGGLYISFLLQHYKLDPFENFWLMFFYSMLGLSGIYFVKFIGLKITGWVFNSQETANTYIFIVFIINKMIGILLLPLLILLAFGTGKVYSISLTVSWCLVAGLLLYRVILTLQAVRNQVKVNPFHFFLYICAFEIAPLLLIYKGLLLFFRITA